MASLLTRVRTTLAIHAHRKAHGMLDGEYTSIFHGRSVDFDDLRPYVAGDELRDVDWKATARHGAPLIRRYVAARKQTVLFVVDTGRHMAALAESGESKRDIVITAAGVLGYLAVRHGDRVGLIAGSGDRAALHRPGGTEAHLERMLQRIHTDTTLDAPPSDLAEQLEFVIRAFPLRRAILVVISDDRELGPREERSLRRLSVQHEILWLTVSDADLLREDWVSRPMHDVATALAIPAYLRSRPGLREHFTQSVEARARRAGKLLDALAISNQRLTSVAGVIPGLLRLLEMHRHASR